MQQRPKYNSQLPILSRAVEITDSASICDERDCETGLRGQALHRRNPPQVHHTDHPAGVGPRNRSGIPRDKAKLAEATNNSGGARLPGDDRIPTS